MDDEPVIREVTGIMLTKSGYDVEFAREGTEVIEQYQKAKAAGVPFDVVVMDLIVPNGMGGEETIRKLLEIDPEAAAIISSGHGDDPIMKGFREFGFKGALPKPYTLKELRSVLNEVIGPKG